MRRIIAAILVALLVVAFLPTAVFAADASALDCLVAHTITYPDNERYTKSIVGCTVLFGSQQKDGILASDITSIQVFCNGRLQAPTGIKSISTNTTGYFAYRSFTIKFTTTYTTPGQYMITLKYKGQPVMLDRAYSFEALPATATGGVSTNPGGSGSGSSGNKVASLTLSKSTLNLAVGKSAVLSAAISPITATSVGVLWVSSNNGVASVSSTGKVTAHAKGKATITAIAKGGGPQASCAVTTGVAATKVKMNRASVKLTIGKKVALKVKVTPSVYSPKTITWKSNKPAIAKVTKKGVVVARKKGTTVITATAWNGVKAKCKVVVR